MRPGSLFHGGAGGRHCRLCLFRLVGQVWGGVGGGRLIVRKKRVNPNQKGLASLGLAMVMIVPPRSVTRCLDWSSRYLGICRYRYHRGGDLRGDPGTQGPIYKNVNPNGQVRIKIV